MAEIKHFRRFYVTLLLGVLTFSGCDFVYRMLDKEGAEEKEIVGEVIPMQKNPTIEELQTLLKVYGYNPGPIDGALGLRTRNAIEEFQKDNNLKESRFADQETWSKLKEPENNQLVVDGKINVVLVQKVLNKAGFSPGKIDGVMGPKTTQAIKIFQREYDLKVDGKLGFNTLNKMSLLLPVE